MLSNPERKINVKETEMASIVRWKKEDSSPIVSGKLAEGIYDPAKPKIQVEWS